MSQSTFSGPPLDPAGSGETKVAGDGELAKARAATARGDGEI
ncbi:MAG TPA: hypothetical protein VLE46_09180 [Nitrospira sp.]|nr:hypothetical protein [Nitrospira sp.]